MHYQTLKDFEGIELESGKPFRFACCDCGLVHDVVIVSADENPVGFAVKRNNPATADRRLGSIPLEQPDEPVIMPMWPHANGPLRFDPERYGCIVLDVAPPDGKAQQDAGKLGAQPVKAPSQSREPILRAMANNYSCGHHWDHLDSDVCLKAADEIRDLRAAQARYNRRWNAVLSAMNATRATPPLSATKLVIPPKWAGTYAEYEAAVMRGEVQAVHHTKTQPAASAEPVNHAAYIYNSGYMAGHQDTVEGCFTDILSADMATYHGDVVSELLDGMELFTAPVQLEPSDSPTKGMSLGQRIAHVGGRNNAQGYIEFGSPMAVDALIQQVLRDMATTGKDGAFQARYRLSPDGVWSSWGHVTCGVKGHEQELRYLPNCRPPVAQPELAMARDDFEQAVDDLGNEHSDEEGNIPADAWHDFARALLKRAQAAGGEDARQRVIDAIAEALGDAYDCNKVWSAWSYRTMESDDFALVAEDDDRVAEIADAAISAMQQGDSV